MAKKKVFSIGSSLAEALEESIESAQNYSGELHLEVLPLSRLETDPDNPRDMALTFHDIRKGIDPTDADFVRKSEELESLQSIAHSIKTQGIINPVTVYKHNDKYRLIAGERRTLASIVAGKTDIQARILDSKPDELKISLLQWIENIERKDLSLWERLRNLEKILEANTKIKGIKISNITVTELSNLIGCAKSHAMNYKAVLGADNELKTLIAENKIRNLEKAALISGIEDKASRNAAIQACLEGANLKQIKNFASQVNIRPAKNKQSEKRGRHTVSINFGATKNVSVAKVILTSVLENKHLSHIAQQFRGVDWTNHRSVTEAFKALLKKLEEIHT